MRKQAHDPLFCRLLWSRVKASVAIGNDASAALLKSWDTYAYSGPKPSVVIDFEGLKQKNCYVTLLSKSDSTGPHSVYDGDSNNARYSKKDEDFEIWQKFVSYKDRDGFYFLQYFDKIDDNSVFRLGYYPPKEFKILVYFHDYNSFAVSNTHEMYINSKTILLIHIFHVFRFHHRH